MAYMVYTPTATALTREPCDAYDGAPLQFESILPAQFFAELRGHATGERRLLVAILEDAIHCFQRFMCASRLREQRLFHDAEQWIMQPGRRVPDGNIEPHFSFEQVCEVLRLDPDYLRTRLQRRRQLARICPPMSPSGPHPRRTNSQSTPLEGG